MENAIDQPDVSNVTRIQLNLRLTDTVRQAVEKERIVQRLEFFIHCKGIKVIRAEVRGVSHRSAEIDYIFYCRSTCHTRLRCSALAMVNQISLFPSSGFSLDLLNGSSLKLEGEEVRGSLVDNSETATLRPLRKTISPKRQSIIKP